MKTFKIALLTFAVFLAASASYAQMMTKTPGEFAQNVAVANKFEIISSKLALKKSKDTQVRTFAKKMIDDHTKAGADFKKTLPNSSVIPSSVSMNLDDAHKAVFDKLKTAKGMDFDRDYIKAQVDAHKEAVTLFTDYAANGSDKPLQAFAKRTLPILQMHQKHVTSLSESILNNKTE